MSALLSSIHPQTIALGLAIALVIVLLLIGIGMWFALTEVPGGDE